MRSHDHRRAILLPLEDADDVAHRIHPDIETETAHACDEPIAAKAVFLGQRHPPAAALRRRADGGKVHQGRDEARAVDADIAGHGYSRSPTA
jgi:hypothetical protein